jgi:ABC-type transport system involved in multi-copper enzyme maturation permease subunit
MGKQLTALVWLALRQLWITFRLLPLLALPLTGGLATVLLAESFDAPLLPLAVGVAAAFALCAGLAAGALSRERRSGRAAWLTLRAVPRSTIVLGWFAAIAVPVVVGVGASAFLAWIAIAGTPGIGELANQPVTFAALGVAAATVGLQAVGIGLAAGSLARPWLATLLAIVVMAGLLVGTSLLTDWDPRLPIGGLWLLAHGDALTRPLSDGVMSAGIGLAGTGLLVALSAALFSRVDL